jgi:hypothetical protein
MTQMSQVPQKSAPTVRNNSAPPKWSKLWTDIPRPGDDIVAYTTEQTAPRRYRSKEHMNDDRAITDR